MADYNKKCGKCGAEQCRCGKKGETKAPADAQHQSPGQKGNAPQNWPKKKEQR